MLCNTSATFKVGARFGPEAIRSASVLLRPYNPELDVHVFATLSCIDYGDAPVAPGFIHESHAAITATLRPLAEARVVTLSLGGDHSVALPELRPWQQSMDRWRSCSSILTAICGIVTMAGRSIRTARRSAALLRKG